MCWRISVEKTLVAGNQRDRMTRYTEFVSIICSALDFLEYLYLYLIEYILTKCKIRRKSSSCGICICPILRSGLILENIRRMFVFSLSYRTMTTNKRKKNKTNIQWVVCWKFYSAYLALNDVFGTGGTSLASVRRDEKNLAKQQHKKKSGLLSSKVKLTMTPLIVYIVRPFL